MAKFTLEECRQHLGETAEKMTDEEILRVRDDLYTLAEIAIEHYLETKNESPIRKAD